MSLKERKDETGSQRFRLSRESFFFPSFFFSFCFVLNAIEFFAFVRPFGERKCVGGGRWGHRGALHFLRPFNACSDGFLAFYELIIVEYM